MSAALKTLPQHLYLPMTLLSVPEILRFLQQYITVEELSVIPPEKVYTSFCAFVLERVRPDRLCASWRNLIADVINDRA